MDSNLILYDMDQFIHKYTRFILKNVYISNFMYQCFFKQYEYLYQELDKVALLYRNHSNYQKVMNIKRDSVNLVKLHNKKYLKNNLEKYQSFFEQFYSKDVLNNTLRSIILCDEESMLVVQNKNRIPFIICKIKYLVEIKHIKEDKIFILVSDEAIFSSLQEELNLMDLHDVKIVLMDEYKKTFLDSNLTLLSYQKEYQILCDYLMKELFPKKEEFQKFYLVFGKYIYLNKDYLEYDTFSDYHNYMYKRMFLTSKLSLKKYNEKEISKRKELLRTIQNESVNRKEEVDIANFLYLNSISYQYVADSSCFLVEHGNDKNIICYVGGEEKIKESMEEDEDEILLYSKYLDNRNYLEQLAYELVKRRYPMEKVLDEEVYGQLKITTMDWYFHEFIVNKLIPWFSYYKKHQSFSNTRLSELEKEEALKIYHAYQKYLEEHQLIEEEDLEQLIFEDINLHHYRYLFLVGDISFVPECSYLKLISDYQEVELIKGNVKLLYDYKKYLYANQSLPVIHSYLGDWEINKLTCSFLKENLTFLNQKMKEDKKNICICFYEDKNRLQVYPNIASKCISILDSISSVSTIVIALNQLKEINLLVGNSEMAKINRNNVLLHHQKIVPYEETLKIEKNYSYIILPFMISSRYHVDLLQEGDLSFKIKLYVALTQCKEGIYLLCPISFQDELKKLLRNFKNITIYEEGIV